MRRLAGILFCLAVFAMAFAGAYVIGGCEAECDPATGCYLGGEANHLRPINEAEYQ